MTDRIDIISFPCSDGSVYSVDVQKQENSGTLHIKVVKHGNILKDAKTSAAYDLVDVLIFFNNIYLGYHYYLIHLLFFYFSCHYFRVLSYLHLWLFLPSLECWRHEFLKDI